MKNIIIFFKFLNSMHGIMFYYFKNFHIIFYSMFFQTFQIQRNINNLNSTFSFNKILPSARKTLIVFAVVVEPYNDFYENVEKQSIDWFIWQILSKDPFFKSVIVRTTLLKYNYDFLYSHAIYYDFLKKKDHDICFDYRYSRLTDGALCHDDIYGIKYHHVENSYLDYHFRTFRKPEYRKNNVAPFWILLKTHPILLKGFLVLRFKKTYSYINRNTYSYDNEINLYSNKVKKIFRIAKKALKYYFNDNNPSTCKITNNKKTPSENSENIHSVNLSSDNNASLGDNASPKNTSFQSAANVFAPYAHLWTSCKNCERSVYKQWAQKNKYICKNCAFHLPMESSDRIESLIDLGTWDPTNETLVSIDPYDKILRKEIKEKDSKPFFDRLLFLDNEDYLEQKNLDLSPINEELLKYLGLEDCTSDEILETVFEIRNHLRIIAGIPDITSDEIMEKLKKQLRIHKKKLEDLINSLPSDSEDLDPEGTDPEKSTMEQTYTNIDQFTNTDQSTADIDQFTNTDQSTADIDQFTNIDQSTADQSTADIDQFTNTDQSTADIDQFTNIDQSTADQSIAKKYTLKELAELFLIEEIETKAEIEEKEKNLASADNKDANQNSENSTESEDSEKYKESEDSENSTESEDSENSTESEDSENSTESEDSEKYKESEDSEKYKESEDSENSTESEDSEKYKESEDSENSTESEDSENSTESEDSENSTESEDSEKYKESEDSEKYKESEDSENSTESEDSEKYKESEDSENSTESEDSEEFKESEQDIPYMDKVDFYQKEKGLTDAVQTGIGQLDGIPVALAVMDFQFIGGSMGSVVGEKITRLIEYATNKCLPLIISCASGGARMQEGTFSLMQMAKISSALLDYQVSQNLLLVSLLTSPTTGGVTASFGMLGDIIIGEPDAYIAFAGKRVIEEVMKIIVPEGVQEAEYLFEKGSLDLIVPRNLLKGVLSELLKLHGFFPLNQNKILNLKSRYEILYKKPPGFQSFEKKK